ncbi:MAG: hypothetical protein NZ530_07855 [Thermodesulfobacteriaceae bacterium]|nr:hypothetical protein [Thermodesulfobacteriaceae bacterium]MDW8136706.1 hypothetical protein [Thermodesulfobacterium sp.]
MRKNYKTVVNFLTYLLISAFLWSCAVKPSEKIILYPITEGQSYRGKIWWKLELYNNREDKRSWGGYANFEVGAEYLYLLIKNFLGGNLVFLKWEIERPQEINFYDFKKKKVYIFLGESFSEIHEIPLYFLGLKKEISLSLNSILLNYIFLREDKKGFIISDKFQIEWQIKEIELLKEDKKTLKEEVEKLTYWEVEIFM